MKAVRIVLAFALVATAFTIATPVADACQPLTWVCPLNGQYYRICGTASPPPIVQCTLDTLRDATIP